MLRQFSFLMPVVIFLSFRIGSASPYLQQLIAITPKGSTVEFLSSDSPLADFLDQTVLDILSTPTGRILCGAVTKNQIVLQRSFFTGSESVSKVLPICQRYFADKIIHIPFQKSYYLIKAPIENIPVDGWTTPRNETFFFLAPSDLRSEESVRLRLTRSLIHELAISYDKKEQMGLLGGVHDFMDFALKPSQDLCLTQAIYRRPLIKHSLSSMRAFDFEAQVARELGIAQPEGFSDWSDLTCSQKFSFLSPYMEKVKNALQSEALVNAIMDSNSCSRTADRLTDDEAIAMLDKLSIEDSAGKRIKSCDFLSKGLPFQPGLSFRGGPGPRIGGGGWSQISERNLLEKNKEALGQRVLPDTKDPLKQIKESERPLNEKPKKTKDSF